MELKFNRTSNWRNRSTVLIVPLWNWNRSLRTKPRSVSRVLIVPLWNWNELRGAVQAEREPRSNCTFMELKSHQGTCPSSVYLVLIVPLWNWNSRQVKQILEPLYSSNCTFMELKFEQTTFCKLIDLRF